MTVDLMEHYKIKLLNVSTGKFDGCYSRRFKGLGNSKGESAGFKVPEKEEKERILNDVVSIGEKLYSVPSFTNRDVTYTVDMNIGICECHEGLNGSVCKHQYILWVSGTEKSTNFLPYLDPQERKKYAEIAIGTSLPTEFYEGLHDRVINHENSSTPDISIDFDMVPLSSNKTDNAPSSSRSSDMRRSIETVTAEECRKELEETFSSLENMLTIHSNDSNFLRGINKFCDRVKKYPFSRLSSSLHSFGVSTSTSIKVNATTSLSKVRKGKIYVQPGAVNRRKVKNGSKSALIKGMNVRKGAFGDKEVSKKRPHKLSVNVANNEMVPKKAGRHMFSKSRKLNKSKKQKTE